MSRRPHWNNYNETRGYPLSDAAAGVDDQGLAFVKNFLADLRVVYPRHLGAFPFIAAASSADGAVSLILQACSTVDNAADDHTLLATITVPRSSLREDRLYDLRGGYPGVAGYVAFGSGTAERFQRRFSSPAQSGLALRSFRAARSLPVEGIRKAGLTTALTGLVALQAEAPAEIVTAVREINGEETTCAVLRLSSLAVGGDHPLLRFAGPCAARPDSRTCGDPQPIEFIGATGPDCRGRITIEFTGCAKAYKNADGCHIVLDCELDLADACDPPYYPSIDGTLPGDEEPIEFEALTFEGDPYAFAEPAPEEPPAPPPSPVPFETAFKLESQPLTLISGAWQHEDGVLSSSGVGAGGARHVAVWDGGDVTTYWRRATAWLRLPSSELPRRNGGILVNRREVPKNPGRYDYFVADVDFDAQLLQLTRHGMHGSSLKLAIEPPWPIRLDAWYGLSVAVAPRTGMLVEIQLTLECPTNGLFEAPPVTLPLVEFEPDSGLFGVHAYRAHADFSIFRVEAHG